MKFCQSVVNNAAEVLLEKKMKHMHTILIGENASGKSAVIKKYIIEMLDRGEEIYYVDSVNRYFDVSKVSTPYPQIQNSSNIGIVKTRVEKEYFNLKDTFSLFGTLNDQIELIYLEYEKELQEILKSFLGVSFELKGIKEKEVRFAPESEGSLSSGIQALVRIFLELLYLNDMIENNVMVVIDEIDEFLSPANAGKILNFLIAHFSKMKFLVSTHSSELVKNSKHCNIMILYHEDIEVVDSDDFCDECDVSALFEKVFPYVMTPKDNVGDKLRILLNNRISGVWTKDNDIELSRLEGKNLTNSQKLLVQQIKEW